MPRYAPRDPNKPKPLNPRAIDTVKRVAMFARLGATDPEIASFLGIAVKTWQEWRGRYPKLKEASRLGKDEADERVIRALYQRALGYEQTVSKLYAEKSKSGGTEYYEVEATEKIPGEVAAQIWWLKNRRSDEWRDRQIIGLGGDKGGAVIVEDRRESPREIARLIAFALAVGKRSMIEHESQRDPRREHADSAGQAAVLPRRHNGDGSGS